MTKYAEAYPKHSAVGTTQRIPRIAKNDALIITRRNVNGLIQEHTSSAMMVSSHYWRTFLNNPVAKPG